MAECGFDACTDRQPLPNGDSMFDFTYKAECYRTETQAFCDEGQVVRFLVPSKSPTCVSIAARKFITRRPSLSAAAPLSCGKGLAWDGVRCGTPSAVEFGP